MSDCIFYVLILSLVGAYTKDSYLEKFYVDTTPNDRNCLENCEGTIESPFGSLKIAFEVRKFFILFYSQIVPKACRSSKSYGVCSYTLEGATIQFFQRRRDVEEVTKSLFQRDRKTEVTK